MLMLSVIYIIRNLSFVLNRHLLLKLFVVLYVGAPNTIRISTQLMDNFCFIVSNWTTIMLLVMILNIMIEITAYWLISMNINSLSCSNGSIYPICSCVNDMNGNIRSITNTIVNTSDIALAATNFAFFGCDTIGLSLLALKTDELVPFIANLELLSIISNAIDVIHAISGNVACYRYCFNNNTRWFNVILAMIVIITLLALKTIKFLIILSVLHIAGVGDNNLIIQLIHTAWISSINDGTDSLCPKNNSMLLCKDATIILFCTTNVCGMNVNNDTNIRLQTHLIY